MKIFLAFFFLFLVFAPLGHCQYSGSWTEAQASDLDRTFRDELSQLARNAAGLKDARVTSVKNVNDSYQFLAEAIFLLGEKGDVANAISRLDEAIRKFDGNRSAYLLLGAAYERIGEQKNAAGAYANFYRFSLTLSPIESRLISGQSLDFFKRYIETRFKQWGLQLPESKIPLGIQKVRSVLMIENSQTAQWINIILPMLVVGGLILLLFARILQIELPEKLSYGLVSFYLLGVGGYALWAAHFFIGLPFFISIQAEFALFFGIGAAGIMAFYSIRQFWVRRAEEKIQGIKRCPQCRQMILKVEVECPECRYRFNPRG